MSWLYLTVIFFSGSLMFAVVMLANKNGSKAAQLEALKAELKKQAEEQERAKKINDSVCNMSDDDVRQRLHEIANKQR